MHGNYVNMSHLSWIYNVVLLRERTCSSSIESLVWYGSMIFNQHVIILLPKAVSTQLRVKQISEKSHLIE